MSKRSPRQLGFWLSAASVLAVAWYAPSGVHADTWYVDDDAPPGLEGIGWDVPFDELQDALDVATAGDEIHVAGGTYRPDTSGLSDPREATFQLINDVQIKGGYAGWADPLHAHERDIELYESILSGDLNGDDPHFLTGPYDSSLQDNSYHVVSADESITDTENTILEGFTITGGNADVTADNCTQPDGSGAGLYNVEGSPTVSNCRFIRNYARCYGAGMANFDEQGEPSDPSVSDCVFEENWAGCVITGLPTSGGGIYNFGSNPTVDTCAFVSNRSGHGGFPPMRDSHDGAGICNDGSHPSVVNCIFSGNTVSAGSGGAIANRSGSNPTITNCTLTANAAEGSPSYGYGGGIYNNASTPTVTNCILWANSADNSGPQIYGNATVTYSCVEGGWSGEGNIETEPEFFDPDGLDDDPRTWEDNIYYLQATSLCIDAGTNNPPGGLPAADFDGTERPLDGDGDQDAVADMGAYEFVLDSPRISVTPSRFHFGAPEGGANPDDQSLYVRNSGVGTLNWEIHEQCAWLEVAPTSGQSTGEPDEVVLSVDITDLDVGEHRCVVEVVDPEATNSPQRVLVVLYVGRAWYVDDDAPNDPGPGDPDVSDPGENGTPEHPFDAIQEGIDAAIDYETVLVLDGTYTGQGNKNLDFSNGLPPGQTRAITVRSQNGPDDCIIDCEASEEDQHRAFYFHTGETRASMVQGFTITNGYITSGDGAGGGIICEDYTSPTIADCRFFANQVSYWGAAVNCQPGSSPLLTDCIFAGNRAGQGGAAVYLLGYQEDFCRAELANCTFSGNGATSASGGAVKCKRSDSNLTNCIFSGNSAHTNGGGVWLDVDSNLTLSNSLFSGNKVPTRGGGVRVAGGSVTLANCTFHGNAAQPGGDYGGALSVTGSSSATLTNCVLWGDTPQEIGIQGSGSPVDASYCNVQGGWEGEQNSDADPNFLGGPLGQWTQNGVYDSENDPFRVKFTDANAGGGEGWGENDHLGKFINPDTSQNLQFVIVANTATEVWVWVDWDTIELGSSWVDSGDAYQIYDYHLKGCVSPCIDTGNNAAVPEGVTTDLDGNTRIMDGDHDPEETVVVDRGAYEKCFGDLNTDGTVGLRDLAILLQNYGKMSGATWEEGDLDCDGDVDLTDLGLLYSVYGSDC